MTFHIPKVTTKLKPKKPAAGDKPKLAITLGTPGTTASGKLAVTIKQPEV